LLSSKPMSDQWDDSELEFDSDDFLDDGGEDGDEEEESGVDEESGESEDDFIASLDRALEPDDAKHLKLEAKLEATRLQAERDILMKEAEAKKRELRHERQSNTYEKKQAELERRVAELGGELKELESGREKERLESQLRKQMNLTYEQIQKLRPAVDFARMFGNTTAQDMDTYYYEQSKKRRGEADRFEAKRLRSVYENRSFEQSVRHAEIAKLQRELEQTSFEDDNRRLQDKYEKELKARDEYDRRMRMIQHELYGGNYVVG